jgi:cytochrome c-type biogenesis protein CcmE
METRSAPPGSVRISKLGTLLVVASALAWLVKASEVPPTKYLTVEELVAGIERWENTPLKIRGFVESRTIVELGHEQTFILAVHGKHVRVHHFAAAPDTLRDGSEVVVTGHLVRSPTSDPPFVLESHELFVKCGGKSDGKVALDRRFR